MTTTASMNGSDIFESHRSRLFGIAYRMLGIRTDAEDLVQDAYLRWHQSAAKDIESPLAFLVTVTKRLCLDRLRELKQHRARFADVSLPELIVEDPAPSPEAQIESKEALSAGFLVVLERLGPTERAAFLLHDVFDYDYDEVARILRKSEECCRQTLHRARARLHETRARFSVAPQSREYQDLLKTFLVAVATGDRRTVSLLLAQMGIAGRNESAADSNRAMVQVKETASAAMMDAAHSPWSVPHLQSDVDAPIALNPAAIRSRPVTRGADSPA